MEQQQRYTLGSSERLKSKKAIDLLFKEGKSFVVFPYKIMYALNDATQPKDEMGLKAGFTVSTRYFKKAVDRNRIRRLTKEAYRLQKNELQEICTGKDTSLNLFFIYIGKEVPPYELVFEKLTGVLQRLKRITTQSHIKTDA